MRIETYLPDGTRVAIEYDDFGNRTEAPHIELEPGQQAPAAVAANEGIVATPSGPDGSSPIQTLIDQGVEFPPEVIASQAQLRDSDAPLASPDDSAGVSEPTPPLPANVEPVTEIDPVPAPLVSELLPSFFPAPAPAPDASPVAEDVAPAADAPVVETPPADPAPEAPVVVESVPVESVPVDLRPLADPPADASATEAP